MTLSAGTKLGPYEIVDQLGAGGMGVVYRARDNRLQRDVAVKLLPTDALGDDRARARFRREAVALARLAAPGIATLFDVGEQDGASYLVMECVAGRPLDAIIADGPLPVQTVAKLGVEIAGALEEAHEQGIVHRDLKPGNVMVTPKGHAKVLDFGIAKLLARADDVPNTTGRTTLSDTRGTPGTLLYMSPEQATGDVIDYRSDLWSLGVLLYEALAGEAPFRAPGAMGLLHAITQTTPDSLHARRADVPPAFEAIVSRALAKNPAERYQSAADMRRDLETLVATLTVPASAMRSAMQPVSPGHVRRWRAPAAVLALVVLVGAIGGWTFHRSERRHWAREQAIPDAARLQTEHPLAAFQLLHQAAQFLPTDSQLTRLVAAATRRVSVLSSPPGATVEIRDYLGSDSGWYRLGTTPLTNATMPNGYYRWRVTAPNASPIVVAPITDDTMRFALDSMRAAPPGMAYVPGDRWGSFIAFVGWLGPYQLPSYYIDRREVTNAEYQRFVDAGGYEKREYWATPFMEDGHTLDWANAMTRLRDSTGRAGPSTWKGGHFPAGRQAYPVSGVSWYEAAAYAAWAGKSLPTVGQWYHAAPPDVASSTVKASNISRDSVVAAGAFDGLGPFGTVDMAGNVKEWIANPLDANRRLILGGAWTSPSYLFSEPEALSAFDRAATNGIRCVKNVSPLPSAALAAVTPLERDFTKVTPASDAVFNAYRLLYAYDHRLPLNARVENTTDAADWRRERVTFDAAYGGERMSAYLFLPKRVEPPYQTVVFSPSARVLELPSNAALGDTSFFDYVVQSGRAVVYPIYQGMYDRTTHSSLPRASQSMTLTAERYQDLARTFDYLATRADVDTSRMAYLGVSMGAADGVIFTTLLQNRLKTDVLLDGGFFLDQPAPGRDQADFAPRLKIPVLMVNGRYDFSFSLERAQLPLFHMLGTPAADKRHVVLDTPHDVRARRPELIAAVIEWLNKYLGPVRTQ